MPRTSAPVSFGSIAVKTPLVQKGQRIGVMGGSFNPPHEGHAIVAATALKRLQLDQLWWLVTPGNPLKSNGSLAPLAERLAACARLAQSPRMRVTAFEAQLKTPYTAATLRFLQRRYPGVTFIWVMARTIWRPSTTGSNGASSPATCRLQSSTGPAGVFGHCPLPQCTRCPASASPKRKAPCWGARTGYAGHCCRPDCPMPPRPSCARYAAPDRAWHQPTPWRTEQIALLRT